MKALAPTSRRDSHEIRLVSHRVAFLLLFILTSVIPSSSIRAQGTALRVETFSLRQGGQVRVENQRGATRVETWDDPSVRVVAEKKSPAGSVLEPSELMLMSVQNTIVVQCRQVTQNSRIDLTINLPRGSQLQLTGGLLPVDVSGSFASAVIETTTGNVTFRLPVSDNARVSANTVRGIVRSTVGLYAAQRTGLQGLQGKLGSGASPIIINSQSGNITLAPGPSLPPMVTAAYEQPAAPDAVSQSDNARRVNRPAYDRQAEPEEDLFGPDKAEPDANRPRAGRRAPAPSNQSAGGGGMVVFAGGNRSDEEESVSRGGPFVRPRVERNSGGGDSGLRVRIIPSNQPLGARRDSNNSVYDQADDDYDSSGAQPSSTRRQPGGDRSTATRSRSGYDAQSGSYDSGSYNSGSQNARRHPAAPDDQFDSPPELASSNSRPSAPPVLRRGDAADAPDSVPSVRSGATASDAEEEAIVLKAALVNLNVSVTNRSGAALPNLKREDFQVAENGQSQAIEFFQPTTAPFNLVLVLDLSGSIQEKLDVVKSAALRFLEVIGPQDKVAVVAFTDQVSVISQLTADRDALRKRIKAIEKPAGGTAFYEALWFTLADTLRGTRGQRNAIVVMTDGVDSSLDRYNPAPTRVTFNQLAHRLEESDVIVFPIYLDTEYEEVFERGHATSEAYAVARDQLARVADLTGGELFKAEKASDLSGVYKQVAAAIRTVYSIGYYPTNAERDGTFRRVRVTVNRSDAAVRSRKGYYAR